MAAEAVIVQLFQNSVLTMVNAKRLTLMVFNSFVSNSRFYVYVTLLQSQVRDMEVVRRINECV